MSELLAIAGATLLGAATLPQAIRLLRTRQAGDFGWAFSIMNLLGLAFLAARSYVIDEWAFLAINTLTTAFWGLVLGVKLTSPTPGASPYPGDAGEATEP